MFEEFVSYDPSSGDFVWLASRGNQKAGSTAGTISSEGYREIRCGGNRMWAHRLAFRMMGEVIPPRMQVDHINGDRADNSWSNLRLVTPQENRRNSARSKCNKSGHLGVTWYKPLGRWLAHIKVGYKSVNLGYFDEMDDAVAARKAAEIKYGFHKNHGRARRASRG